jgi:hypothetical protein
MRRPLALLAAFASLAFAGEAAAEPVVVTDDAVRSIAFEVKAEGVDVEWYADLLPAARTATRSRRYSERRELLEELELESASARPVPAGRPAVGEEGGRRLRIKAAR